MEAAVKINHAISHRIYLLLQKNHLNCLITDKNKTPLLFETFEWLDEAGLSGIINSRSYFSEIYSSCRLILAESKFTLVPAQFHLYPEEYEPLLSSQHRIKSDEMIVDLELDDEKKVICSVYKDIYNPLSKAIPGCRTVHMLFYLLNDKRFTGGAGFTVIAALQRGELFITVSKGRQLLLANCFDVKNEEELKYFVMAAVEQLQLDLHNTTLFCPPSEITSEQQKWFNDYFSDVVSPVNNETDFSKLDATQLPALKKAYILQSALLCE